MVDKADNLPPNIEQQRSFFDSFARKQNPSDFVNEFRNPSLVNILQRNFVFTLVAPKRGEAMLEMGVGIGQWAMYLLSLGIHVTAIDISEESLRLLKETYLVLKKKSQRWGELTVVNGTCEDISYSGQFDKVFCSNLLHHVANPQMIVKKMSSAVKSGGHVIALEPNPITPLWYVYFKFIQQCWEIEKGVKNTSAKLMRYYFKESGLTNITCSKYGVLPLRLLKAFPEWIQKANFNIARLVPFYMFHVFKGYKR